MPLDNFEQKKKELTDQERIAALQKEEKNRATFAALKDVLQLIDLTKTQSKQYTIYSKENLRSYLQNPSTESNQKSLRKLSKYLYTVSYIYRRLITNKANQLPCKNWIAYPKLNDEGTVEDSSYENYIKVCNYVENMKLHTQVRKCLIEAWMSDVCFGYTYGNPEENTFFIHMLDPDYCKISSVDYYSGKINFAFNFSFFDGQNSFYLDVYDPEFKKMYNKYKSDSNLRWQQLPPEKTFCIKINEENLDYPMPPLAGLFNDLIDLADLTQIQAVKDELSAYKLIFAKINTISGTKEINDFEIDLKLAGDFFAKLQDALPEGIAAALTPMELDSIDFAKNATDDVNMVNRALNNLIESNGDIVLNSNRITNSASFAKAVMAETMSATSPITQINTFVNFYIKNNLGVEDVVVEFSDVSPYFVQDRIDQLLKLSQYGIPVKTELASLSGLNPAKCRSMEYLEEKLGLAKTKWTAPLVSSNVQTGLSENGDGSEGAPTKDERELTDSGEDSRDKDTNPK